MKKILYLGPVVDPDYLNKSAALSPAANLWQINFIKSLISNKKEVILLTYLPMQKWPRGKLWVTYPKSALLSLDVKYISTSYLNLPFILHLWLPISLYIKAYKYSKHNLITFNPVFRQRFLAIIMQCFHRTKWYSIIADDLAKGKPFASIFLSYGYFKRIRLSNKYFFEGGIPLTQNNTTKLSTKKILIYAGSISKWTGINEFTEQFKLISEKLDIEFHIYGNGNAEEIKSITSGNNKIKFMGFVTSEELDLACKNAYAFVNPRPTQVYHGENNFPSKVLLYLAYQKPIISTRTEGLSPEYDKLLVYYEDKNSESFINAMFRLNDNLEYSTIQDRIKIFSTNNTWENKTKKLLLNLNMD